MAQLKNRLTNHQNDKHILLQILPKLNFPFSKNDDLVDSISQFLMVAKKKFTQSNIIII
jgi:phage terminase large subunit-like protein